MEQFRIAVQGADPLSHEGLTSFLQSRPDFVVLPGDRPDEAQVTVVSTERFSVDVAAKLRRSAAAVGVPVVLVINELTEAELLVAVECRVVAILPRSTITAELLAHSVRSAVAGGAVMPPNLIGTLLRHIERLQNDVLAPNGLGTSGLTSREIDVLRLTAEGFDTAEIAGKLSYSERTVKNVVHGLTRRLNLRNRSHAVAYALRSGMI
ncbi:response regulator transcription factor [Actinoplanes sp. M2I2]|uniref:helix-turn-helix transcriptional regulator n=1 Tax=Actinoplanes sp. M2I2 TaxID=1734444 RepID=UPI0020215401|nr:response regulator transcription factor [Actinoplanes sp. M2I2]